MELSSGEVQPHPPANDTCGNAMPNVDKRMTAPVDYGNNPKQPYGVRGVVGREAAWPQMGITKSNQEDNSRHEKKVNFPLFLLLRYEIYQQLL